MATAQPVFPDVDDRARRLVELGLAPAEARCYVALLHIAPATAREVAGAANVAQAKVYDALRRLEQRGFCAASGEPVTTYRAVDPELALEEWTRGREHARRCAAARDRRLLADLVASLPAPAERSTEEPGSTMALTGDRASTTVALERLMARSDRRLDLINSLPVLQPRSRWNVHELAALERGVRVRMLFVGGELAVDHRYEEILAAGGEVRIATGVAPKLLLRDDGAEALVALPNPADANNPTCVAVCHEALVAPLQLLFNREWRRAREVRAAQAHTPGAALRRASG